MHTRHRLHLTSPEGVSTLKAPRLKSHQTKTQLAPVSKEKDDIIKAIKKKKCQRYGVPNAIEAVSKIQKSNVICSCISRKQLNKMWKHNGPLWKVVVYKNQTTWCLF